MAWPANANRRNRRQCMSRPKVLGLDQKVRDPEQGWWCALPQTERSPADEAGPNPSGCACGTW